MGSSNSKPCHGWSSPCYGGRASKHSTSPDTLSIQSPSDWSRQFLVPRNSPDDKRKGIKFDSSSSDSGSSPYRHGLNGLGPSRYSKPCHSWDSPSYGGKASKQSTSPDTLSIQSPSNWSEQYHAPPNSPDEKRKGIKFDSSSSDSSSSLYRHQPEYVPNIDDLNRSGPSRYWPQFASSSDELRPSSFQYGISSDSSYNHTPNRGEGIDYYYSSQSSSTYSSYSNGSLPSHQPPSPYYGLSPNHSPPTNDYYPPPLEGPENENYNALANQIFRYP